MSVVTELQDVVLAHRASAGVVIASGGFGKRVLEQKGELLQSHKVHLRTSTDISYWIDVWQRTYGSALFTQVNPIAVIGLS